MTTTVLLVLSLGLNLFLAMAWHIARRGMAAAQGGEELASVRRLRQANADLLNRVAELDAEVKQYREGEPWP